MGLYTISCHMCSKEFLWFSGHSDQRCPECQKREVRSCILIASGLVCVFNAMKLCGGVEDISDAPYHCPALTEKREQN